MPIGETFWNPYRMIPVREEVEKRSPLTDEKFQGRNGTITCTLKNLTPLFIAESNEGNPKVFLKKNMKHIIPGSSLKGMLRSLAEVVGGGCFVTDNKGSNCHERFKSCDRVTSLCIVCRMFGMMEQQSNAKVHKGNISIGDAVIQTEDIERQNYQVLLSAPKTRHGAFYITPQNRRFDGKSRKFYFHQPQVNDRFPIVPINLIHHAWEVDALTAGHDFQFDVSFSNLREEELNLLIYVLTLEQEVKVTIGESDPIELRGPLRHKIGNAKPMGMGSCHIEIVSLTFFADPVTRFSALAPNDNAHQETILNGDRLTAEIDSRINGFVNDHCATMEQLRKVMVWDTRTYGTATDSPGPIAGHL